MNNIIGTKPWYLSKGVMGSLVAVMAGGAGLMGWTLTEANQAQLVDLLIAIAAAAGGIASLIGRVYATREITVPAVRRPQSRSA